MWGNLEGNCRTLTLKVFQIILIALLLCQLLGYYYTDVVHAATFNIGDTVEVTTNLNVRAGPGTSYPEITDPDYHDYAPAGTQGQVLDGPISADGYIWWRVDFGPGLYSGWSVEGGLEKIASTVLASISSYSPSSIVEVTVGSSTTISVTFTNTGNTAWNFIAGATVWDSGGSQVANYSKTLSTALQPGQQTTVNWNHTVSQAGDYWLQFGVWKATPYIAENLLSRSPSPSQLLIRGVQQNQPPTCSISSSPSSGDAPLAVTFSMNADDPDGTISAWLLDADGDGNADYSGTGSPPPTKPHTYTLSGTYNAILMVSDDDSASANSITTVNVGSSQIPPTCALSVSPQSGKAPLAVTFSLTASDSDGCIETWVLDVDEEGAGNYSGTSNPSSTISHTYTTAGIHTAVLMVSDDDDLTAAATSTVSVSASGQPALSCSPASFSFSAVKNGANPSSQSLNIWNSDEGTLSWTVSDGANWLNLSPTAGSSTGETDTVTVSASISGKDAGIYNVVITVSASGAANAPQNIPVTLTITGSDTVTFPDAHLEAAIRGTLGKSTGDITQTDLAGITILSAPYHSISNLSGLEYCTSLSELNLLNNSVTDISPLAGCTQLYLLTLTGNQVTDISALASLPALKLVYLGRNQISDVSPLSGLQYLQRVVLFSNQVSDISPLAQNTGIGSGEELDLRTNPLSEVSIDTYIPQLQSRGVNVLYDSSISITRDPASLTFTAVKGGNNPAGQTISVWRSGAGSALNWTISEDAAWLTASPTSGSSTGEQDTVTASVNIAGMDSGVYQTDITISAAGAANSPQTVPVTLNISDAAKPDLIIETIMWSPQNPSVGDTVTFTVTVKNQGSTQAGSSYVYYFIDGVQYTYDSVYSINSGASRTETFTWKIQQGVHTIVAVADYRGQITENNESNNEKTISFSPALSDLIVQSITWLPEHPSVGDSVTFTVTIKNQGNGDAASSKVYYFVDDSQQGYDSVYSLDAGETTTETFTWTAEEGTHTIRVVSDYANVVSESDESNNEKTINYSATALPDLIIQSINMTPENPEAGDSLTFTVTLMNQGTGDADSSKVYYFIDDIQQDYDSVYALDAGSTTTETFSWTMMEDSHVFKAFIDYDGEVPESDEENNEKVIELGFSEEIISTPQIPAGTTSGTPGNIYEYYSGGASSNLGHEVEYRFDWGNGNYSAWSTVAAATYPWPTEGVYTIRTQARCAQHPDCTSDWSPGLIVTIDEPDEITAEILDYEVTPRKVEINNPVHITLSLYNTGNVPWTFYAVVSLRKPGGQEIHLPLKAVQLETGQRGSAAWDYTTDSEGSWDAVFGIWKESYQSTSLDYSGWLQDFVDCIDEDETGYSIHFDIRNMLGFDDGAITAYDIRAYIEKLYPQSPMLVETDIGEVFISAGIENNINPAFLVATAELEGRFGTAGWGASNPQAHNTMGWDVKSSDASISPDNSADTWGEMIERVAYYIAHGSLYYRDGRFTVEQIRDKYAKEPNSASIVRMMEALYAFAIENPDIDIEQLRNNITRRLQQRLPYPDYLVSTWIAPDLADIYDELYQAGIDYDSLSLRLLIEAREFLNNGNYEMADKYNRRAVNISAMASASFSSATEVFNGSLDASEKATRTIKELCEWTSTIGLTILNPTMGKTVEYLYSACDIAIDYSNEGLGEAIRTFISKATIEVIFNQIPFEKLGGRTIADYSSNRIGKITFPFLETLFEDNEVRQFVTSKLLKELSGEIAQEIAEQLISNILKELGEVIHYEATKVESPVELRLYDSQGRVTGLVNGTVRQEIPGTFYAEETVTVFFPKENHRYEIVGTEEGTYGLQIVSVKDGEKNRLHLTDVSTSQGVIHEYTLDWDVVSKGGEGITMKIDSDADGNFERIISLSGIEPENRIPFWVWICVGVVVGLGAAFGIWRYRLKKGSLGMP